MIYTWTDQNVSKHKCTLHGPFASLILNWLSTKIAAQIILWVIALRIHKVVAQRHMGHAINYKIKIQVITKRTKNDTYTLMTRQIVNPPKIVWDQLRNTSAFVLMSAS